MTEYRVVVPEEEHGGFEFTQDDLWGTATVNVALSDFEPKIVFGWHLSILIDYTDHIKNKLPSPNEQELLYNFEDFIDPLLKAEGNALFLARVTHGGQRELVWRVYDPEKANGVLEKIIKNGECPRPMDYRIDKDEEWKKSEWFLDNSKT